MNELADLISSRFGDGATSDEPSGPVSDTMRQMLDRRSCRHFTDEPVPHGLLKTLLACAQCAPTKSDLQQYSIVLVSDSGRRDEIASLVPSMPFIRQAARLLVFCGDIYRNRRLGDLHALPHDNDNLDSFFNATVDASLAMQSFILAAESAGLGCCPLSAVRNHMEAMVRILELPEGVFPIAGLCVGWPVFRRPVSMRLPPALVVHENRYRSEALEEEVVRYDERRHAVDPIGPAKQRNVDRYGEKPSVTWSENTARQLSVPERPDFGDHLRRRGLALR